MHVPSQGQPISDADQFKTPPTGAQRALLMVQHAVRHPATRRMTWGGLGAAILLTLLSWQLWRTAVSESCHEVQKTDLTLGEMGDIKRQLQAFETGQSDHILLNSAEATFLFAEALKHPVWLEATGQRLNAEMALEDDGRCYNVRFEGLMTIRGGVANVYPSKLIIGDLDLTALMGGKAFSVHPEEVTNETLKRVLSQTAELSIHDSKLRLVINDIGSLM